jgi:hypothetical protein
LILILLTTQHLTLLESRVFEDKGKRLENVNSAYVIHLENDDYDSSKRSEDSLRKSKAKFLLYCEDISHLYTIKSLQRTISYNLIQQVLRTILTVKEKFLKKTRRKTYGKLTHRPRSSIIVQ